MHFHHPQKNDNIIILPTSLLSLFLQNKTHEYKGLVIDSIIFIEIKLTSTNV